MSMVPNSGKSHLRRGQDAAFMSCSGHEILNFIAASPLARKRSKLAEIDTIFFRYFLS